MKRILFGLFILVLVAGYLGTFVARDPGYVLVRWQDYSLITSIWIMLALLLVFVLALHLLLRLWRFLTQSGFLVRGWQKGLKEAKTNRLSRKGLRLLAEGEYGSARKYLNAVVRGSQSDGLNYLAAARAANATGDSEGRETYLRLAATVDSNLSRARAIVGAELALARDDAASALSWLEDVAANEHVAILALRALHMLGDWRGMLRWLSKVKTPDIAMKFERQAAMMGLDQHRDEDGTLKKLFKSLSSRARQDVKVIESYVKSLSDKTDAEPVLRAAIKKFWLPELLALYGVSDAKTLPSRCQQAEAWLEKYPEDAALHYCLGCLYQASEELARAQNALTLSLELGYEAAGEKLAECRAAEGDYEAAFGLLKDSRGGA